MNTAQAFKVLAELKAIKPDKSKWLETHEGYKDWSFYELVCCKGYNEAERIVNNQLKEIDNESYFLLESYNATMEAESLESLPTRYKKTTKSIEKPDEIDTSKEFPILYPYPFKIQDKIAKKIGASAIENEVKKNPDSNDDKNKFLKVVLFILNRYEVRYNTILNRFEYRPINSKTAFSEINEDYLIAELMENGNERIQEYVRIFLRSQYVSHYNPLKAYVLNLEEWTPKQPDYIKQLASYVDAEDQHWFTLQFTKMLVRMLACSLGIIRFNKQCFILTGCQDGGKSSFLRFLCPSKLEEYITEDVDFFNKDGLASLAQNFIINLDDFEGFDKKDISKVKSFISREKVKIRLPYAKKPQTLNRCANFVGTTNEPEFLSDVTGNVRFLVFNVKRIIHDWGGNKGYEKNIDIDKVYSQAFALLKAGFDFRLSADELKHSEKINSMYQVATPEAETINRHFAAPSDLERIKDNFRTATDIAKILREEFDLKTNNRNVGKALHYLGYEREQVWNKEYKVQEKGYYIKSIKTNVLLS